MPFRDREWEDFQRDCDLFPAYTDYLFGVDTRPHVANEPGLHPQIYDRPPRQRLLGLPLVRPVIHNEALARPHILPRAAPSLSPATPTPAPRTAPVLLRPGQLTNDQRYTCILLADRVEADRKVTHLWSIINSAALPTAKAKATGYLKDMSRMAAAKKQEYEEKEAARLEAELVRAQRVMQEQTYATYSANCNTNYNSTNYIPPHTPDLRAYVHARLPQLNTCTALAAMPHPLDGEQQALHAQAMQYLTAFAQSVPLEGRAWVGRVLDAMGRMREEGRDPLGVLDGGEGL